MDTAAVNIPDEGIGPAKPHGVPNRFASLSPARDMRIGVLSVGARAAAGARHLDVIICIDALSER